MRYKARRKKEIQTRTEKTEHRMSEPPPIQRITGPREDCVPLRLDGRTVRHVRVGKIERNLTDYARQMALSEDELLALVASRRYTPEAPPLGITPRSPGWYVSDMYNVPGEFI